MLDLQDFNSILKNRKTVHIGMVDHIGNVTVNKDFTRSKLNDLFGRNSGIGTA
jgi:hypothetical protein